MPACLPRAAGTDLAAWAGGCAVSPSCREGLWRAAIHCRFLAALWPFQSGDKSPHSKEQESRSASGTYWPHQAWRDALACLVVAAAVVALSLQHGYRGPNAGIEFGAPANPVDDPGTARPEWSFRGLYQLHETLAALPEMVSIILVPGLTVLVFFLMPLIAGQPAGRIFNTVFALAVLVGLAGLTSQSYVADARNDKYQAAVAAGRKQAERVKELAVQPSAEEIEKAAKSGSAPGHVPRIPVSGALALLENDPKTQGPRLFNQHCASCHQYGGAAGVVQPEKPTASDLAGFAGREWLGGFLTVNGIGGPKYFGNTKFRRSKMYGFVKETFADYEAAEKRQIVLALSARGGVDIAGRGRRPRCGRDRGRKEAHRGGLHRLPRLSRARPDERQGPGPDRLRQPRVALGHDRQSGP